MPAARRPGGPSRPRSSSGRSSTPTGRSGRTRSRRCRARSRVPFGARSTGRTRSSGDSHVVRPVGVSGTTGRRNLVQTWRVARVSGGDAEVGRGSDRSAPTRRGVSRARHQPDPRRGRRPRRPARRRRLRGRPRPDHRRRDLPLAHHGRASPAPSRARRPSSTSSRPTVHAVSAQRRAARRRPRSSPTGRIAPARPGRGERARRRRRLRLHAHRRGPAPLRRPGRRARSTSTRSSRSPTPAGCSPASTSPTSRRRSRFTVTAPGALAGRLQLPHARSPSRRGDGDARPGGFAPTPRLSHATSPRSSPGPYHVVRDELRRAARHRSRWASSAARRSPQHLDADDDPRRHPAGLRVLRGRAFDCPYPFAKYDQLFVPGVQRRRDGERRLRDLPRGLRLPRPRSPRRTSSAARMTILHEMAHMWFGDLVTMRWWDDLWLNESFAEYASHPLPGRGHPVRRRLDDVRHRARRPGPTGRTSCPRPTRSPPTSATCEAVEVNFDGITYAKGASVLKQLVAWVGQEPFLAGLRAYFRTHAWGNTDAAPTCSAELEATSGRDLDAWAEAVAARPPASTRCAREVEVDADGAITSAVAIVQDRRRPSHPTLRPHRLARRAATTVVDGAPACAPTASSSTSTGERTEVPELVGRAPAGPAAGQRRRPDLRQDPARRALAGHRGRAPRAASTDSLPARPGAGARPGT